MIVQALDNTVELRPKHIAHVVELRDCRAQSFVEKPLLVLAPSDAGIEFRAQQVRHIAQSLDDLRQLVVKQPLFIVAAGRDFGEILRRTRLLDEDGLELLN